MRTLLIACLALHICAGATAAPPPVFSDLTFEEAQRAARAQDKFFLLSYHAEWANPSTWMNKNVWVEPSVVGWVREHAIAIQWNQENESDSQANRLRELKVQGMPVVLAFHQGALLDRLNGATPAAETLAWLIGLREKVASKLADAQPDALRRRFAASRADQNGVVNLDARLTLLHLLLDAEVYEEAAEEFLWLWDHMLEHDPSYVEVRHLLISNNDDIYGRLRRNHPPVRDALAARRDRLRKGTMTKASLLDWIRLNRTLRDYDAISQWFKQARLDPGQTEFIRRHDEELYEHLDAGKDHRGAGLVIDSPLIFAKTLLARFTPPAEIQMGRVRVDMVPVREWYQLQARWKIGDLYANCLLAGREAEAAEVATTLLHALNNDDSRLFLVESALQVGEPRAFHREWIRQMSQKPVILSNQLNHALEALGID